MWLNLIDKWDWLKTRGIILLVGSFFMSTFWGCAALGTYNPATGRKEFVAISTASEVVMGDNVHQQLSSDLPLVTSGPDYQRINMIGQRLAKVSDRQDYTYSFYLIEKEELNAFTTPGGNVYFYSGLLNQLTSDDQVAAVLAHEIGHCAAKHTAKQYQAAVGYDLLQSAVLSLIKTDDSKRLTSITTGFVIRLASAGYSRKDEIEADRISVRYMQEAGYDPKGLTAVLKLLKNAEGGGSTTWAVFKSHPDADTRIKAVEEEISFRSMK